MAEQDIGATPGIVRTHDDVVLDTLSAQVDWAEGGQRLIFEGRELASDELAKRGRELALLATAVSKRLEDVGVRIVGCWPENNGLGARFKGLDRESRVYEVDLHLDDELRFVGATFDSMLGGLDTVQLMESSIRAKRAEYLETERLALLGLVLGRAC